MSLLKKIVLALVVIIVAMLAIAIPYYYGVNSQTSQTITDVATFLANVATVIALFFLALEIRNSTKSRRLEGAIRLFDRFNAPDAREARRVIYSAFADQRKLEKNEIDFAEKIRADFDEVGIMAKEGLFPKKIALIMYSDTAIRCWEALEKHIKKQRELRGTPAFMQYFEWFYNESKRYRDENYPEEKKTWKIFKQT